MLARQNNRLVLASPLKHVFEAGEHERWLVSQDEPAASVNGNSTEKLRLNIGLDTLGSIDGAMGGSLAITAPCSQAKSIKGTAQN